MNINGLTQQDIKTFKDLLLKANTEQLQILLRTLQEEFLRRT